MEWLVLLLIIAAAINASRVRPQYVGNRIAFYKKHLGVQFIIVVVVLFLAPAVFWFSPFEIWKPKTLFLDDVNWLSILISVSSVNFAFSFTNLIYKNRDLLHENVIFGLPNYLLPSTWKEWWIFTGFISGGVVFEELIFRLVLFGVLYETLGLTGWPLIVSATIIFSLGHAYQGIKGLVSSSLMGILFAIIYLITETLWWPIAIHAIHNYSIVVYSARRIIAKQREVS